jgi:acetoin:2,6-dichlorophenolindophenol oxidoreductase subunit beta
MKRISYAAALVEGLDQAMQQDDRIVVVSGHLLGLGPHRTLIEPLHEKYHDRFLEPPNSEAALAGLGAGAAMAGDRPLVNFSTANFTYLAWSQIANDAGVAHHMTNGAIKVPVVFYAMHGVRGGGAAQHNASPQGMLWNCPGLEIVLPASPADAKGLIGSAFGSNNPTVFLTHAKLLGTEGPVPEGAHDIPLGQAEIKRAGRDVTVVATSYMVVVALTAAEALAQEGIDVEVVDPRTLVPLDEATILSSVRRTGRAVVVDECHLRCSPASEIAATISEHAFDALKAPVLRVARADVPTPFSAPLEAAVTPDRDTIMRAVRRVLGR